MILGSELVQVWVVRITSLLVLLSGLLAIDRPLSEKVPERLEVFLLPFGADYASRSVEVLLGVALVYVATQLWQRKRVAWLLAVGMSLLLFIIYFFTHKSLLLTAFYLLILLSLLGVEEYFKARSEIQKVRRGGLIFLASILFSIGYGTWGFWLMDTRDFGVPFDFRQSVVRSLREYTLMGNDDLHAHSRRAQWFLDSLGLLGASSILFGLYSLFRPLAYEYAALPSERRRVTALLERHSMSSDDYFKLWPHDKSYFFTPDGNGAIAYGVAANVALAVGDPVGTTSAAQSVLKLFNEACLTHGWLPCHMYVQGQNRALYETAGYELLKVGEDGVVSLGTFAGDTSSNKHFRNVRNRFDKDGFTVALSLPPHDRNLLKQVTAISTEWLKLPGRKEWQFLAGSYSPEYMAMGPLFVAKDRTGRVQAFANQIPTYRPGWATIDLMRYRNDAPKNTTDYLLMMIMLALHEQGLEHFNLGLAPLAGLGEAGSSAEERLLSLLYGVDQKFLSVQGLRRYKDKFQPTWEPKYMAYRGGAPSLARIAYALNKLMRKA